MACTELEIELSSTLEIGDTLGCTHGADRSCELVGTLRRIAEATCQV